MALNLVAPVSLLRGGDLPAARRLASLVESLGGGVLFLGAADRTDFVLARRIEESPASQAAWAECLRRSGWSPDETVLLADSPGQATLAASARVKTGALRSEAWVPGAAAGGGLDETWADLDDLARWIERHGQLAKRAWPIATVGGLVFAPDQTALFVRTAKWSGTWGVPGGKIDYGEPAVSAFLREIREETGIEAFDPALVLVQDAIEEPEFFRPRHFLLLNYRAKCQAKEFRLNHESLEAGWFTLDQAGALELNRPTRALVETLRST